MGKSKDTRKTYERRARKLSAYSDYPIHADHERGAYVMSDGAHSTVLAHFDVRPRHIKQLGSIILAERRIRRMATDDAAREYAEAIQWTRDNAAAWRFMTQVMDDDLRAQRRISAKRAAEEARALCFTDNGGKTTRIRNAYVPALARIYLEQRPEARPYIVLHPSKFDLLGVRANG